MKAVLNLTGFIRCEEFVTMWRGITGLWLRAHSKVRPTCGVLCRPGQIEHSKRTRSKYEQYIE